MTLFSPNKHLTELLDRWAELSDLRSASGLLSWDQETYMPPDSAMSRSYQLSSLAGVIHTKFTDPKIGTLLDRLQDVDNLNIYDQAVIRIVSREYHKAVKLPVPLVKQLSQAVSIGFSAWQEAKLQNDFRLFAPALTQILELKLQAARLVAKSGQSLYDTMLDDHEQDLTEAEVSRIFVPLASDLKPLVTKYARLTAGADQPITGKSYDLSAQWQLSRQVAQSLGFNFERGRLDKSAHPFTTEFSSTDVRITSWENPTDLRPMLMATIHETGHALYEQGIRSEFDRTPLAGGNGLIIHESQSRLWENLIGRSPEFWHFWWPRFQEAFPPLRDLQPSQILAALNHVHPDFIRVEADEITYHLHVIIRFEIERRLIKGKLKIADLPQVWDDYYQRYLGVTPPSQTLGVLQDVHWSHGSFGYFPTYSLGTILSAQLMHTIRQQLPDLTAQIKSGQYTELLNWLRDHLHQHGRLYTPQELILKTTGEPLNPQYFIDYLKHKFTSFEKQ